MVSDQKEVSNGLERRIKVVEILDPEAKTSCRILISRKAFIVGLASKVWKFLRKAWDIGVDDPKKVIHGLKVGMALTLVSLFYYMTPLYDVVGQVAALWEIMTVVVVFENTVGATLSKCFNRICGTFLAGFLAVGVQWVASKSGHTIEPIINGVAVFLLASLATFSRFIPSVKAWFDYGAMIFVLTFSLVSISGFRVAEMAVTVLVVARQRLFTIVIGTVLCIIISMLVCPIWAGQDLHTLIFCNIDKLADSLEGCVAKYFKHGDDLDDGDKECQKKLQGYKCVLSSKATEDSLANFATWEPAHGRFNFRHPWKQYIKIGESMRSCAYCIDALNGCINSENQPSEYVKMHISNVCLKVSFNSSDVIRELAWTIKTMKKSSNIDFLVGDMNKAVQELQFNLNALPKLFNPPSKPEAAETPENKTTEQLQPASKAVVTKMPIMDIIPLVTLTSLLIEIVTRINGIVDAVEELAGLAEFKPASNDKCKKDDDQLNNNCLPDQQKDKDTMNKVFPLV
ncbi:aluminum-activated malate transporter 10-like [Corylus avellana]|uniref:aluminum-activated malate transporter 10-like n=1 Tax=Corylus avellana TaxID=13451 RepID=UPI00286C8FDF|nr:aluminum-activated malate transporter 10-like [Corylus avellana]